MIGILGWIVFGLIVGAIVLLVLYRTVFRTA
jgi:hypothetical protein